MEIDILQNSPAPELDLEELRQSLATILQTAGETNAELAISLVSDETIRELSRRFLDRDAATDVLSFPQRDETDKRGRHLGDIVISIETARRQAGVAGSSVEAEVRHLAAHGLLHLFGYEHDEAGQEKWNEAALRFGLSQHVLGTERTE